jgi:hypothetical protein
MNKELILDCLLESMRMLKDNALEAKADSLQNENDNFKRGISFGYYEVLHLLEQQVKDFGLTLEDINLNDLNPDKDLLGLDKRILDYEKND